MDFWLKDADSNGLELYATITNKYLSRTPKQLGYLYAEIYPKFFLYMHANGMDSSDEILKTSLKLHPDVMFCDEVHDVFTGEVRLIPKSCAANKASKEEVTEFIDRLIRLAAIFEIDIEDPESYKKRKGITSDEWQNGYRK